MTGRSCDRWRGHGCIATGIMGSVDEQRPAMLLLRLQHGGSLAQRGVEKRLKWSRAGVVQVNFRTGRPALTGGVHTLADRFSRSALLVDVFPAVFPRDLRTRCSPFVCCKPDNDEEKLQPLGWVLSTDLVTTGGDMSVLRRVSSSFKVSTLHFHALLFSLTRVMSKRN